jgi:hypothetical protein
MFCHVKVKPLLTTVWSCLELPLPRGRQLCGYPGTSRNVMEPDGSLPQSQEPFLSQIDSLHIIPSSCSKIRLKIICPPMSWSSFWISIRVAELYQYVTLWSLKSISFSNAILFITKTNRLMFGELICAYYRVLIIKNTFYNVTYTI